MRCRNCGSLGHRTQSCLENGPWFPEPGKSKEDYAAEAERIANLVAADVMAEHEGRKLEETYEWAPVPEVLDRAGEGTEAAGEGEGGEAHQEARGEAPVVGGESG